MVFRVRHATHFHYAAPAYESHNEAHLRPCDDPSQLVLAFDLKVTPARASIREFRDYFGNWVHSISIYPPHDDLTIIATAVVEKLPALGQRAAPMSFERYLAGDEPRTRKYCEYL